MTVLFLVLILIAAAFEVILGFQWLGTTADLVTLGWLGVVIVFFAVLLLLETTGVWRR